MPESSNHHGDELAPGLTAMAYAEQSAQRTGVQAHKEPKQLSLCRYIPHVILQLFKPACASISRMCACDFLCPVQARALETNEERARRREADAVRHRRVSASLPQPRSTRGCCVPPKKKFFLAKHNTPLIDPQRDVSHQWCSSA